MTPEEKQKILAYLTEHRRNGDIAMGVLAGLEIEVLNAIPETDRYTIAYEVWNEYMGQYVGNDETIEDYYDWLARKREE